ncbi:cell division protein PerM [Streptomyces sp. NPDC054961]
MTQVTERGTSLPKPPRAPARRRSPAAAACAVGGAVAAGLGLGFLAVLVIVLWISSPYPDSGPGGALHLAAGLWLLAHGTELVRYETLSGVPAPVGLTPLLLIALPALLIRRAARLGSAADEDRGAEPLPAGVVFSAVLCGYLGVGAFATVYAAGGPMPADPLSAAWHLPLVAALAAAGGVWEARGRPLGPLPARFTRPRYELALRAGAGGALVLLGGGALVVAVSLAWHGAQVQSSFGALTGVWSGRFAVLLLAFALIPNAVVWGAAYALGPGFALGAGAAATPLGWIGSPALPRFPLLAALPAEGPGTPLTWAVAGVPVVAGLAVGWFAVRRAREVSYGETALTAALGALVCALATAGLAAASAGPLGSRELAAFGPVWWQVGGAALAWTVTLAVPLAVTVHAWRNRPARGLSDEGGRDGWHDSGVREARWAALRRAAGTLIPDFSSAPERAAGGAAEEHPRPVPASAGPGAGPSAASGTAPAPAKRSVLVVPGLKLDLTPIPLSALPAAPAAPAVPVPSAGPPPTHLAAPPRPLVPPVTGARVLARRKPGHEAGHEAAREAARAEPPGPRPAGQAE